jgi:hypothetical protein
MPVSYADHYALFDAFMAEQRALNPNDPQFSEKSRESFCKFLHSVITNGYKAGGDPVQ